MKGMKSIPQTKLIMVFNLAKEIHSHIETEKCVEAVLKKVSDVLGTEVGSVMLLDEKKQELFIKKATGLDENIVKMTKIKVGEGIAGWVVKTGTPLLVKNLSRHKRFRAYKKKDTKKYSTDSLLSVPLKVDNKIIGVINVNNKRTKEIFTKLDLDILSLIAEQAALAIQNSLLYQETKKLADLKVDFISTLSHELKNPITIVREAISSVLDSLVEKIDKTKTDTLKLAINNMDRLNRLINSLLDLAKLEAGKTAMQRSYIDLKKLVSDCVDFIRPSADSKGIKIKTDFNIKYSKMWGDWDRITEVINNLLSNAVKFTPKAGVVTVSLKEEGNNVLICVQDTGVGIKKEDMPKLFNKFERLIVGKDRVEGTGLGLAICKEIVSIHRGKIWAESEFHKGSAFNIALPKDLRKEDRT